MSEINAEAYEHLVVVVFILGEDCT